VGGNKKECGMTSVVQTSAVGGQGIVQISGCLAESGIDRERATPNWKRFNNPSNGAELVT